MNLHPGLPVVVWPWTRWEWFRCDAAWWQSKELGTGSAPFPVPRGSGLGISSPPARKNHNNVSRWVFGFSRQGKPSALTCHKVFPSWRWSWCGNLDHYVALKNTRWRSYPRNPFANLGIWREPKRKLATNSSSFLGFLAKRNLPVAITGSSW